MNPQNWTILFSLYLAFFFISIIFVFVETFQTKIHNYTVHRVDLGNWYWWRQTIDTRWTQLPPLIIALKWVFFIHSHLGVHWCHSCHVHCIALLCFAFGRINNFISKYVQSIILLVFFFFCFPCKDLFFLCFANLVFSDRLIFEVCR